MHRAHYADIFTEANAHLGTVQRVLRNEGEPYLLMEYNDGDLDLIISSLYQRLARFGMNITRERKHKEKKKQNLKFVGFQRIFSNSSIIQGDNPITCPNFGHVHLH